MHPEILQGGERGGGGRGGDESEPGAEEGEGGADGEEGCEEGCAVREEEGSVRVSALVGTITGARDRLLAVPLSVKSYTDIRTHRQPREPAIYCDFTVHLFLSNVTNPAADEK